ncbi:hypothetical protein B0T25DRAFT_563627 [Lasiosphaeria hispida]|uniref:Chitin-binding type-1 domain-containing protein n=1 Tax=Lasiosphaeria hispida TaxID=260671 RepID=A0AAJ0ML94_9PEZI|nr:hypothetical protein B0T25DRAFT_563627 [Lasiosphaeria hispida]
MRCTYIGLAAALVWTGVSSTKIAKARHGNSNIDIGIDTEAMPVAAGHRVVAGDGSFQRHNGSERASERDSHADAMNLELRQAGGRCGSQYGKCAGDQCCSDYGFCGDTVDHCAPLFNCQAQYGVCGWPRAPPPPPTTAAPPPPPPTTSSTSTRPTTTSTTSVAPPVVVTPTTTSAPVVVTSITTPPPVVTPPSPTSAAPPASTSAAGGLRITQNGMCGNGTICIGSTQYGPCCSQFFWCGSSLDFCGAGCQSSFGACFGAGGGGGSPPPAGNTTSAVVVPPPSSTSSTAVVVPPTTTSTSTTTTSAVVTTIITSAPPPPPPSTTSTTTSARPTTSAVTLPPGMRSSTDGKCGSGVTCIGYASGRCCSQFGYCGDGDQFCPPIVGCQPEFGICDGARP